MKKRVFTTNSGDRIEFSVGPASSSRSNVGLTMTIRSEIGDAVADFTPKEATRFMELVDEIDVEVWSDEMGECHDHELTGVRCQKCGRYCGTKKRCPHCAPRSK